MATSSLVSHHSFSSGPTGVHAYSSWDNPVKREIPIAQIRLHDRDSPHYQKLCHENLMKTPYLNTLNVRLQTIKYSSKLVSWHFHTKANMKILTKAHQKKMVLMFSYSYEPYRQHAVTSLQRTGLIVPQGYGI